MWRVGLINTHYDAKTQNRGIYGRNRERGEMLNQKIVFIVERGGAYLVAVSYTENKVLRWSQSKFDAARIEDHKTADRIAGKVGGVVKMFEPLTGKLKPIDKFFC